LGRTARGLRVDLPHPSGGTVKLVGSPMRMSATPPQYDRPPPLLGQHTDEVLREVLGKGEQDIADLRSKGVI
jgi:formyl-CoA transferase